jgi:hypothetical protein
MRSMTAAAAPLLAEAYHQRWDGTRHSGPATIKLVNLDLPAFAA